MAKRPIFVPNSGAGRFVRHIEIDFKWNSGMAVSQSRKNILALHEKAARLGTTPVLEISSKSEVELGVRLSAFNLCLKSQRLGNMTVEVAFQGSKVFSGGGPYHDIYELTSREAKKDSRLNESGKLVAFDLKGQEWPLEPVTAFYDWLYLWGLKHNPDLADQILDYEAFSDIAFNPEKSINCQARSAALYVELHKRSLLKEALKSQEAFLDVMNNGSVPVPVASATEVPTGSTSGSPDIGKNKRGAKKSKKKPNLAQYELFAEAA